VIETWYAIFVLMLTAFVVLDGWDIGAGLLHFVVGRTEAERGLVISAIGPLWIWNEVWLIGLGGVLFAAFPIVMASAFAGFYLALFLLLWSLILRGIALEVRGLVRDPLWREAWDFAFAVANLLLAVLIGTALGNLIRGVPLDHSGKFTLAFFTNFRARGSVGILDWYTLSIALFFTVLLAAHGAAYLTLKTEGPVHDRSARLARWLWLAVIALLLVTSGETVAVRPELFTGLTHRPPGWLAIGGFAVGAGLAVGGQWRRRELLAFVGSCLFIGSLMAAGAIGVFPVMLQSTLDRGDSITAYRGAADPHGLQLALLWWPVAFVLSLAYFIFIYRNYRGKVRAGNDSQGY
jgi:cytochrome bd ubiquinol oxidase subunit II